MGPVSFKWSYITLGNWGYSHTSRGYTQEKLRKYNLAGGFQLFFYVHPYYGEDEPILTLTYIFRWVGSTNHQRIVMIPGELGDGPSIASWEVGTSPSFQKRRAKLS